MLECYYEIPHFESRVLHPVENDNEVSLEFSISLAYASISIDLAPISDGWQ